MTAGQGGFATRLTVLAQTYVRFASRRATLLDVMFTSLHRPGAEPSMQEANDRAFAAPMALIADAQSDGQLAADDPDRAAMAVLAMLQGLAWLANSSVIGDRPIDTVVAETIETLTNGLRRGPLSPSRSFGCGNATGTRRDL